ncbi:MAG TPA: BON domain-containing protein [Verrucomicrobiae bacterium]|nr:BON domain-containing protein [Verrucomicrobiae bacterium]
MKTASLLCIVSTLLVTSAGWASESHDFDRGLESTLRATLNDRHVHVHVKRGIVTLNGRVPTEEDRRRIEFTVRHTDGVVAVKDDLRVTLPSPAASTVAVPIYTTPAPIVVAPAPVLTAPAPLILPQYPRVTVQAWSGDDQPTGERIARQLQVDALPVTVIDNVTVTVQGGNVTLKGKVETQADRQALITAIQRAGGVRAIYDQLRVRA